MPEEVAQTRRSDPEQHSGEFVRRRRRQRREPSALRRFLAAHRFALLWSAALVVGLFLLFGPLAQMAKPGRSDPAAFLISRALVAIVDEVDRLTDVVLRVTRETNWAIKVGALLLVVTLVALPFRLRWWLMNRSPWLAMTCPRCQSGIHRTHRHALERSLSFLVPMRRYRCLKCGWSGIRIEGRAEAQAAEAAQPSLTKRS